MAPPVLVLACVIALLMCGQAAAEKPNVLFLFADDMRPDVLGVVGHPEVKTPNLDRLAGRGTLFTRAHIMGGLTGAVCIPSRAMMLSGRSLFRVDNTLKNTPTWPQRLREAGYRTHMTGKWHNGPPAAAASFPGTARLFFGGMVDTQFQVPVQGLGANGKPTPRQVEKQHTSELFADEAVRFLTERHDRPWALYVAFTAPHDPREAPPAYRDRYDPAKLTLPANYLPRHPFDNGELKNRDEQLEKWPRTPVAIRKHRADYYAIISHLDAQVGRVLDTLDRTGQAKNTVVVFAGDNGLAIGSHGLMGKQNVYEHSVGVPLIVAGPGVRAGVKVDALCYLLDLCPTLCDLAGAKAPAEIAGRSLVPVLTGKTTRHRDRLLFAYRDVQRGVSDGRWKAIWYPARARWQLFDLAADPQEMNDLVGEPASAARLAALKRQLAELRTEFGDTAPLPASKK
ncbi:MAG: sulfatase-like hydrolase/transferase [Gemmataceae bacterium]